MNLLVPECCVITLACTKQTTQCPVWARLDSAISNRGLGRDLILIMQATITCLRHLHFKVCRQISK